MDEAVEIVSVGEGDERLVDGLGLRRSATHRAFRTHRHAHDFHQVTLLLSSPGHVEWHFGEDRAYSGRPAAGDVVVCPALVPTLVHWDRPFESISLWISTARLERVAGSVGLKANRLRPTAMCRDHFAGAIARKLAEESGWGREERGLLSESLGTALVLHLLREYAEERRPAQGEAGMPREELRRVTDYIEGHLEGDLSLGRLAAVAGNSPHHFLRRFRASVGTTPHQYVIRRRVERARELLVGGGAIIQVAAQVGFSSQSHLHRHIRRLLGVTPGDLARRRPLDEARPR